MTPATTLNLASSLEHYARLRPGHEAVVMGDRRYTYGQVNALAGKVASGLHRLGLRPGDHVALSCPNVPYFPIVYYGILKTGCVVVPLNVLLKPREIAYHLDDSHAKAYLCFEGTPDLPMGAWGKEAFDQVAGCEHFVMLMADTAAAEGPGGARTFMGLIAGAPDDVPTVPTRPDDTAVILYTSGTTGQPKGAELTHLNVQMNAWGVVNLARQFIDTSPGGHNALLVTLPLFHSFGQVTQMCTAFTSGQTIVLLPRFEPAAVLQTMQRERITSWSGVPTMFWTLAEYVAANKVDVTPIRQSLRVCTSAAPPCRSSCCAASKRFSAFASSRATACRKRRPWPRSTTPTADQARHGRHADARRRDGGGRSQGRAGAGG